MLPWHATLARASYRRYVRSVLGLLGSAEPIGISLGKAMTDIQIALLAKDTDQARQLAVFLGQSGYTVVQVPPHRCGSDELQQLNPHLVLYSIWDSSDLDAERLLCLRRAFKVPLVVVGAPDSPSAVEALRLGADGCLERHYGHEGILAHVQAALRRYWDWDCQNEHSQVSFHLGSRWLGASDREVKLTPLESRILSHLMHNAGQVVPHHELYQHTWGRAPRKSDYRSLALCVHNLRRKIERDPHRPEFLLTKWGVGYSLSKEFGNS